MRLPVWFASMALVTVLGLGFTACGGDALQLDPVAKAADLTSKQSSMHMTMTATVTSGGRVTEMTGGGDFDNTDHVGSLTVRFSVGGTPSRMDEVIKGTTIYLRSPLFASELPAGKSWMKLDLQKAGKAIGVDFGSLLSQTPGDALEHLKHRGRVETIGTETLDGTRTTHYRIHVDASKIPQKLRELTHPTYEPSEIWIDSAGLVRRIQSSYSAAVQPGGTARAHTQMTMDFLRFGDPVQVAIPSEDESLDVTSETSDALKNGG